MNQPDLVSVHRDHETDGISVTLPSVLALESNQPIIPFKPTSMGRRDRLQPEKDTLEFSPQPEDFSPETRPLATLI